MFWVLDQLPILKVLSSFIVANKLSMFKMILLLNLHVNLMCDLGSDIFYSIDFLS